MVCVAIPGEYTVIVYGERAGSYLYVHLFIEISSCNEARFAIIVGNSQNSHFMSFNVVIRVEG